MTLLVPLSLSEPATLTEQVRAFAARSGARVILLHVVPPLVAPPMTLGEGGLGFDAMAYGLYDPAMRADVERAEQAAFTAFADAHFPDATDRWLREGDPATVILDEARNGAVDGIVMGHRHQGMLDRFLSGSVARAIFEHAPCPVLVVPTGRT